MPLGCALSYHAYMRSARARAHTHTHTHTPTLHSLLLFYLEIPRFSMNIYDIFTKRKESMQVCNNKTKKTTSCCACIQETACFTIENLHTKNRSLGWKRKKRRRGRGRIRRTTVQNGHYHPPSFPVLHVTRSDKRVTV